MSRDLPPGFELQDELPPGFEIQPDLPPGFEIQSEPEPPSLTTRAMDGLGHVADTAIKGMALPFEPVGESIRGARTGEPLRLATAEDPSGFRAPSIIQKYVPSLRTPEPPADPFAETYGGLRGLTQTAGHILQGPEAALQAGTREIERPRTGYDQAAELGLAIMSGKVGNAPLDAALSAGSGLIRPLLRRGAGVAPGITQGAEIAREAPLALPAPVEGPGFRMMDRPDIGKFVESEVWNPRLGRMEIVRRPLAPGERPPVPQPPAQPPAPAPVIDVAPVESPRIDAPKPWEKSSGYQMDQWDNPRAELPPGFELDSAPNPQTDEANRLARETFKEVMDQKTFREAAQGKLPEGFKLAEPEIRPIPEAPKPILQKPVTPEVPSPTPLLSKPVAPEPTAVLPHNMSGQKSGAYTDWEAKLAPEQRTAIESYRSELGKTPDTKLKYSDPSTGQYAPERQALHEKIIQDERYTSDKATPAPGTQPVVRFVIGPPAAGKSTAVKHIVGEEALSKSILLDNDDIKAMLPEYKPKAAGAFHNEASDVEGRIFTNALSKGQNLILSMIGKNEDKMRNLIKTMKEAGYKTELYHVDLAPESAALRSVKRAQEEGGRFVDPQYVFDDVGLKPRATYDRLKTEVDSHARLTTDVPEGSPPAIIERSVPAENVPERRLPGGRPTESSPSGSGDAQRPLEETPAGSVAPEAPPVKSVKDKPLAALLAELGDDLVTPLKNEKGAIGTLGDVDEVRNARMKENFEELVARAKDQGYQTTEEIAAFLANNGMRGSQIQALMRQFREGASAAAQGAATETVERPPRPILGGGRKPPSDPPKFTVIPPSGGDSFEKYAGNINLQKLSLDDAAKQIIQETAKRDAPILDKARRGKISLEETERMAQELGLTDSEVLKMKRGTALNAEELTAARTQLATYTKEVQDVAQNIGKGGNATADLIRLNQAIQKQAAIQRVISGVTAEAGRALNSMKILVSPENLGAKNMEAMLEALGGREANIDLAKKLASIDPKDTAAVNAFIREVSQPSIFDKIHEVWINAILSNPITHKVNIQSYMAFALARAPEKALTGLADAAIGLFTGKRTVYAREAIPEAMGIFRGVGEGLRRMLYVLKNGESLESLSKLERNGQEAIKGLKGKIIRGPGTALVAEDEFAKGINSVMSRGSLATRQALSEGLEGKALSQRIAELEAKPTIEMMEEMEKEGLYYTFQTPFGIYGQKINQLRKIPGVRYIFPFLRTPLNIAKAGFERSPFGMAGLIPGAFRGELTQTQVAQALSRSAIGSSIAGGLAYWTLRGNVTGRPPKEAAKRDAWYADGKIPYAIKVGNKWRSYQLEPFGAPVGALVDTIQDFVDKKKDITYELGAYYGLNYAKAMLQRSFLQGISNMFDALSDPERYADKQVSGFGSSAIPFSGTLRFITQSIDPIQRQADTFSEGLMATIPGLSTKLRAKLDVFGEPIERPQRAYQRLLTVQPGGESSPKNDPVRKMMTDVDYQLNFPAKSLNKRSLDEGEYAEFLSISGSEIRQNFEALAAGDAYKGYDAKQIRELMHRYVDDARERARQLVEPKVEMRVLGIKNELTQPEIEDLGLYMSQPAYSRLESDEAKREEIQTFISQAASAR